MGCGMSVCFRQHRELDLVGPNDGKWDISTGYRDEAVITRRSDVTISKIRLLQFGVAQTKHLR